MRVTHAKELPIVAQTVFGQSSVNQSLCFLGVGYTPATPNAKGHRDTRRAIDLANTLLDRPCRHADIQQFRVLPRRNYVDPSSARLFYDSRLAPENSQAPSKR